MLGGLVRSLNEFLSKNTVNYDKLTGKDNYLYLAQVSNEESIESLKLLRNNANLGIACVKAGDCGDISDNIGYVIEEFAKALMSIDEDDITDITDSDSKRRRLMATLMVETHTIIKNSSTNSAKNTMLLGNILMCILNHLIADETGEYSLYLRIISNTVENISKKKNIALNGENDNLALLDGQEQINVQSRVGISGGGNNGGVDEKEVVFLSKRKYFQELAEKSDLLLNSSISKREKNAFQMSHPKIRFAYAVSGYMHKAEVSQLVKVNVTQDKTFGDPVCEYWFTPALFSAFNETMNTVRKMVKDHIKRDKKYQSNDELFYYIVEKNVNAVTHLANHSALVMSNRLYGQSISRETVFNIQNHENEKNAVVLDIMQMLDGMMLLRPDLQQVFGSKRMRLH